MKQYILAASLLVVAGAASASDTLKSNSLGARVGTDGIGITYSYGLNRFVGLRAGYHFGSLNYDDVDGSTSYEGELKFSALSAVVDIKPFKGGFRISAGAYSAPPEVKMNAAGTDVYELGDDGDEYYGDLRLDGKVDLGSMAPYLGIGWGGTNNRAGLGFSFDIGAMFTSSPKVSMLASGTACEGDSSACPGGSFDVQGNDPAAVEFREALGREVSKIEEDAKDLKIWPVINFGIHYRF